MTPTPPAVTPEVAVPLPPSTTHQEDLTTAGQRRINLLWEWTQAIIAVGVVLANMITGVIFAFRAVPDSGYPMVLSSSLFLVIGFYFSRTNHAAVGGIGFKPHSPYVGR